MGFCAEQSKGERGACRGQAIAFALPGQPTAVAPRCQEAARAALAQALREISTFWRLLLVVQDSSAELDRSTPGSTDEANPPQSVSVTPTNPARESPTGLPEPG
jgi:hypothetical protein